MESNGLSSLNDAFNVKPNTLTDELESQPDSLDFQPSVPDTIFDSMPTDEQVLPQKSPISTEIPQRIDLSGRNTSYSSTGLYAPVVDSDSSLTAALFRDTTTIGALMNNRSSRDIKSSAELGDFNFINYLKDDMVPYADAFAFDSSEEEMMETEAQVRQELADDALIAANPGKSILYSIPLQLTDPANLLPGGAIYKGFKSASIVTRAATGSAISGIASSSIQETLQQNAQLTRSAQESVFNVLSAGILSGALGAAGAGIGKYRFSKEQHQKAQTEINNVMMGERPSVGAMGVVENEELANIPDKLKGGLKFTARNRLQVSEFTAAQKFAHDIYETNLFQTKNEQGIASSIAVETESKQFKSDYSKAINKMQKVYFESVGVKGNTFKQTRASLKKPEMSFEQYDQAVSYVVTSDTPSGNPTVDAGAKIMKDLYASWAKDLVAAGKLEPDAKPANAAAWFAQVYNQQLIIEQGGARARGPGTFPKALFDDFKATQGKIKQFHQSAEYLDRMKEIGRIKDEIKGYPEKLERGILETEVKQVKESLKTKTKELKDFEHILTKNTKDEIKSFKRQEVDLLNEKEKIQKNIDKIIDTARKYSLNKELEIQKEINKQKSQIRSYEGYLFHAKLSNEKTASSIRKLEKIALSFTGRDLKAISAKAAKEKVDLQKELQAQAAMRLKIPELKQQIVKLEDNLKSAETDSKSFIHNLDKSPERINKLLSKYFTVEEINTRKDLLDSIKRLSPLQDELRLTRSKIIELENKSKQPELDALNTEIKEIKTKLKDLEAKKVKNKTGEQIKALEDRIKEIEQEIKDIAGPKLLTSDKSKLRAIVDDDMLWNQVDNAVDNILGQADGTLLNPALSLLRSLNPSSFKERLILADQLSMRPWHKTSISGVTDMVGRALAPFIAFDKAAKAKGFKDVADWRQTVEAQLKNEYHAKMVGKTGKEAAEITKKFDSALKDMNDSIELIDGIYGQGMNVMTSQPAKYVNYWLTWNLLRLLGGIAISSIPDIGNQIMRNGVYQSIHNGIVPMLNKITAVQSKQDLQAMGHIMETALGVRIKSFADNQSLTTFPNPFERAVDSMAQNFGNLTFINQWNDLQQFWAGTVSINRTLNTIAKIVEGKKVAQKDRTRLAHLGIKERDFGYIYEQTKNNIAPNGTRLSDWTNWKVDNAEQVQAQRDFVNATGKDIRSIVIEPGLGDKPLFAHTNAGKAILQFKSFAFAATNKILISGYQRKRDAEVWQGLVSLLTFGAASYVINTKLRGQEVDYSFANMAHEAIDRSGVIGILTDVVNIAQKSNLFPGENVSRYHTRNIEGALLGPTVGAISEIFGAISAAAGTAKDKELTARDIQAFVRLLPFQNLFYLQGLNRVFVGKIAETFDLEDNR